MGQHRTTHPLLRALGALACAGAVAALLAATAPVPALTQSGNAQRWRKLAVKTKLSMAVLRGLARAAKILS